MKTLTRRAFLKLAGLCGAAEAGLVELPRSVQAEERLLALAKAAAEYQTCTADEAFQRLLDGIKSQQETAARVFRGYDGLAAVRWCDAPFVVVHGSCDDVTYPNNIMPMSEPGDKWTDYV